MKNVIIYPYTPDKYAFVRWYGAICPDAVLLGAVARKGSGLDGTDAAEAVRLNPIGIPVTCNYDALLGQADTLLVLDELIPNSPDTVLLEKAIAAGVEIHSFSKQISGKFLASSPFHFIDISEQQKQLLEKKRYNGKYQPKVPVIMVGGVSPACDFADSSLRILSELRDKGISVSAILPEKYASYLGAHSYPDAFFHGESFRERVFALNHLMHAVLEEEKPKLLVIELPGELLAFDRHIVGNFGTLSYLAMQAAYPDYFVYVADDHSYPREMWEQMAQTIGGRVGITVHAVVVNNLLLQYQESKAAQDFVFARLQRDWQGEVTLPEKGTLLVTPDGSLLPEHIIQTLSRVRM